MYDNGKTAVDGLCLGVRRGECFGLLGLSGAGKTSTFKLLTGGTDITSGEAFVNGYNISTDMKSARERLGYCPDHDAIIEEFTGCEALRFFAALRGVPNDCIDAVVNDLTDRLCLHSMAKTIKEMRHL